MACVGYAFRQLQAADGAGGKYTPPLPSAKAVMAGPPGNAMLMIPQKACLRKYAQTVSVTAERSGTAGFAADGGRPGDRPIGARNTWLKSLPLPKPQRRLMASMDSCVVCSSRTASSRHSRVRYSTGREPVPRRNMRDRWLTLTCSMAAISAMPMLLGIAALHVADGLLRQAVAGMGFLLIGTQDAQNGKHLAGRGQGVVQLVGPGLGVEADQPPHGGMMLTQGKDDPLPAGNQLHIGGNGLAGKQQIVECPGIAAVLLVIIVCTVGGKRKQKGRPRLRPVQRFARPHPASAAQGILRQKARRALGVLSMVGGGATLPVANAYLPDGGVATLSQK